LFNASDEVRGGRLEREAVEQACFNGGDSVARMKDESDDEDNEVALPASAA
jgi:hypothetical protein